MLKTVFFLFSLLFGANVMAMELTSSAFKQGEKIPSKYTCDRENISPPLTWSDVPLGTKSFALIMEDPDAPSGVWDHWILFNIPENVTSLPEDLKQLPPGAVLGLNSWNKPSYGGPCPPDREHRYFFKLYALNIILPATLSADKAQIINAMNGHILASTELMGKYHRK
jgi:Raf kinase inhibitor-like YbhB/YbcL family protein